MTPQERRATIVVLLDHWHDFFQPGTGGRLIVGETEAGIAVISAMSAHVSVVELGRCLILLRQLGPHHYQHLRGFYDAEWRTVLRPALKRNHRGKLVPAEPQRVRERVLACWVEQRLVERGVDFLSGSFRGRPELPAGLYKALHGELREITDGDGTHLTEAA